MLTAIGFPSRPIGTALEVSLADWSLFFRTCKVYGRVFLAKSQKYTMCSDKCRQKMKTQAKRDFDAHAIENEYDHIYKNEAQHWLHYIHRMEKDPECPPERIAEIRIPSCPEVPVICLMRRSARMSRYVSLMRFLLRYRRVGSGCD